VSLERLVEEIHRRAEEELNAERSRVEEEERSIAADRDARIAQLNEAARKAGEAEAARLRVQKVATARLAARKLAYEAKERRMNDALRQSRALLQAYTKEPEYKDVLKRMAATATEELGRSVRISGRSEDAALLKAVAGRSFDDTPQPILGGLVAESSNGERRLNLSFDELLRLREDRLRDLLAK